MRDGRGRCLFYAKVCRKVENGANICTVYNSYTVIQSHKRKGKQVFTESGDSIIWKMNLTTYHQLRSLPVRN